MNGSYGAFATSYFILYNNNVASTITAQGRDLTQTMHQVNEYYWYNMWHLDEELHKKMLLKNITKIEKEKGEEVSIYADTDSVFVSFLPAINHCDWKNNIFDNLDKISKNYVLLWNREKPIVTEKCLLHTDDIDCFRKFISENGVDFTFVVDGFFIKDYGFDKIIKEFELENKIKWNWCSELDFIHGLDKIRYADYFKKRLEEYASSFGVENRQDFELERVSESIINIAKKKYIQHIVYEDGLPFDRLNYIFPKGVELVRSSTPLFARDKIVGIIKYLFEHPDSFNIKELLGLVKNLKKEFDLCVPDRIDDICMQSSCSSYEAKVIDDLNLLTFQSGTHFAVKASAYHNYLLHRNKDLHVKYEFIKSGTKIKYYYCKDKSVNDVFAYIRGSYPIEFAPEIDLDTQFEKSILSPINSIIEPLNLPVITKRLRVAMDIFG